MVVVQIFLIVVLAVLTAGCSLAAGIFKAGFWVGILVAVILVVGIMMLRGRK